MANQRMTFLGSSSVITQLGRGTEANFQALLRGQSGLTLRAVTLDTHTETLPIQCIDDDHFTTPGAELSRLEQLMTAVAEDALRLHESKATAPENTSDNARLGVIVSTTKGNIRNLGATMPEENSNVFLHQMAQRVVSALHLDVQPIVVSNACISGVAAVVIATRLIRDNIFDDVLVIGADEVTNFTTSGFLAFKSVSKQPCKPYDLSRDGLSLGEAVAAVIITADAKCSCGVAVEGGAMTNDANHISGPSRTGQPLAEAIRQAMKQTNLHAADIQHLNLHGTATAYNDEMESKAVALACMTAVATNSMKPYFGHTLGASGVLEIIMCAEEIKHSVVLGTKGFSAIGTTQTVNVAAEHREMEIQRCIKTASGFGGTNAAVVLARQDIAKCVQHAGAPANSALTTLHTCSIKRGELQLDGKTIFTSTSDDYATFIRQLYHQFCAPNLKFFKMDNLCKLGYVAAEILLQHTAENTRTALLTHTRTACIDSDIHHARALTHGNISPAVFVYTLPNIVLGEIAIRHKINAETTMFVGPIDTQIITQYAKNVIASGLADHVVLGDIEANENEYAIELKICN